MCEVATILTLLKLVKVSCLGDILTKNFIAMDEVINKQQTKELNLYHAKYPIRNCSFSPQVWCTAYYR